MSDLVDDLRNPRSDAPILTVEQLRNRLALHDGSLPVHLIVMGVSVGARIVQSDELRTADGGLRRLVLR